MIDPRQGSIRGSCWPDGSATLDDLRIEGPTAPLRFVRPTQTSPYQSLHLLLKQYNVQSLDPAAQQAFTLFSSFAETWEQNRRRHIREAEEMLASLSPSGGE